MWSPMRAIQPGVSEAQPRENNRARHDVAHTTSALNGRNVTARGETPGEASPCGRPCEPYSPG